MIKSSPLKNFDEFALWIKENGVEYIFEPDMKPAQYPCLALLSEYNREENEGDFIYLDDFIVDKFQPSIKETWEDWEKDWMLD